MLDPFQKQSLLCLENNQSVLVSAHTSAGKTVVALYVYYSQIKHRATYNIFLSSKQTLLPTSGMP